MFLSMQTDSLIPTVATKIKYADLDALCILPTYVATTVIKQGCCHSGFSMEFSGSGSILPSFYTKLMFF